MTAGSRASISLHRIFRARISQSAASCRKSCHTSGGSFGDRLRGLEYPGGIASAINGFEFLLILAGVHPWQNGLVERLIGSARRECTDHVIAFNEDHLRRILSKYASYYNEVRTHLSLGKDAPCTRPMERFGDIIAQPILGGLHHRYARI